MFFVIKKQKNFLSLKSCNNDNLYIYCFSDNTGGILKFTVVISTNNLSSSIDRLISDFSGQNYSDDDYEVIIENYGNIEVLSKIEAFSQFKLLNHNDKKSFIATAVENSAGEFIILANDEYSYNENYLFNIQKSFEKDDDISSLCVDVCVDYSKNDVEGKFLKELKFLSMETLLNVKESGFINELGACFDNFNCIKNIAFKRSWYDSVYESYLAQTASGESSNYEFSTTDNLGEEESSVDDILSQEEICQENNDSYNDGYSLNLITKNNILSKCRVVGNLYYDSSIVVNYIVKEEFSFNSFFKEIGEEAVDYFDETEHDVFRVSFPIPLLNTKFTKDFSFSILGNLYFSSFFMMHIFALLFVIDMVFFSALFSSLSPWMFLILTVLCFMLSFNKEVFNENKDVDKAFLLKFKYLANFMFFAGMMTKNFKLKSAVVSKPLF